MHRRTRLSDYAVIVLAFVRRELVGRGWPVEIEDLVVEEHRATGTICVKVPPTVPVVVVHEVERLVAMEDIVPMSMAVFLSS